MDRYYIGSGNIAGIAEVSPYSSRLREYLKIIGELDESADADKAKLFKRRLKVEPFVCSILEDDYGYKITERNVRYQDDKMSYFKSEIDAGFDLDGRRVNVGIKSVSEKVQKFGDEKIRWGDPEDADHGVPLHVLAQDQFGLGVTNRERVLIVGQIGFDDDRLYWVERDEKLIKDLRDQAEEFWNVHVLPRVPPPPKTLDDAKLLYPRSTGSTKRASADLVQRLIEMAELDHKIKVLKEQSDAIKVACIADIGEAERALDEFGNEVLTYRTVRKKAYEVKAQEYRSFINKLK